MADRRPPRPRRLHAAVGPHERWSPCVLPPLVLGAVVIGVWYFISYVVLDARRRFLLRPPHEVVAGRLPRLGRPSREILDGAVVERQGRR